MPSRGEARTFLDSLLYDRSNVTWSVAEKDVQLNRSAQAVADDIAEHSRIAWGRLSSVVSGSASDIALSSVVGLYRLLDLTSDLSPQGTEQLTVRELSRKDASYDDKGRWYFAIYNDPSAVFSDDFSDSFLKGTLRLVFKTNPGGTWTLSYVKAVTEIETGTTHDQEWWAEIPPAFADQVSLHAAAQMLGPRMEESSAVVSQLYGFARDKMIDASKSRSGPLRTAP